MRQLLRFLAALVVAVSGLPAAAGAVDIKTISTPLGIKAWLVQDKSAPAVSLSFSFAGGTASDPEGQLGVTTLMATLLSDGAGTLTSQAFRQRQEDAAASVGFSASLDRLGGSLRVLSANREEGFELLRLALTQPRFDSDMIDQRRAQTIAAINQASQRPASVAARTLMETEFAGHPYANDPDGTPDDLRKLTQQTLKQRAAALLIRNGLVVAAVGDIDEADLARLLDRTFGTLPPGTPPALPPEWKPPTKARTVVVERPVPQSTALLALPGVARDDPDWYAALVMNHILGGGGQQSRLFTEVREKRGPGLRRLLEPARLQAGGAAGDVDGVGQRARRRGLARGQGRAGAGFASTARPSRRSPTPRPISPARWRCRSIRRAPSRACCIPCRSTTWRPTISPSAPP